MKTYQIYAAATSTGGDNVANIMLPSKTRIREMIVQMTASTVDSINSAEVSLASTSQFTTNDATSIVGRIMQNYATAASTGAPAVITHPGIDVQQGSKVYLHINLSASQAWRCVVTIIAD